jgi:hypothetical protein
MRLSQPIIPLMLAIEERQVTQTTYPAPGTVDGHDS